MTEEPFVTALVLTVSDLDRSSIFYQNVLSTRELVREEKGAMLVNQDGFHLYLRCNEAPVTTGSTTGIAFAVWAAASAADFERAERWLGDNDALVSKRDYEGSTIIEGRDPDGIPILVGHPPFRKRHPQGLFDRIYD